MPILASLVFGFAPMLLFAFFIYWLDRYEKEPRFLLTSVFFWGVVIAAGGAFIINTLFGVGIFLLTESELTTDLAAGSLVAPLVEESLKGLAVLIVFLLFAANSTRSWMASSTPRLSRSVLPPPRTRGTSTMAT
jgi:RsiW-degrading membrane proteinase PrsW (M82 family)